MFLVCLISQQMNGVILGGVTWGLTSPISGPSTSPPQSQYDVRHLVSFEHLDRRTAGRPLKEGRCMGSVCVGGGGRGGVYSLYGLYCRGPSFFVFFCFFLLNYTHLQLNHLPYKLGQQDRGGGGVLTLWAIL